MIVKKNTSILIIHIYINLVANLQNIEFFRTKSDDCIITIQYRDETI